MMRPPNTLISSITWLRTAAGAFTVTSISSRSTESRGSSSEILMTFTSLFSCFTTCSSGAVSTSTTTVMRLKRSSSVGATARE